MAHAGKSFPRATYQDFRGDDSYLNRNSYPARKLLLKIVKGVGTFMTKWENTETLSEKCERMDDSLRWIIPHASVSVDDPQFRIYVQTTNNPFMHSLQFRFWIEYWEAGSNWGTLTNDLAPTSTFAQYPFLGVNTWDGTMTGLITPAKFTNSGSSSFDSRWGSATWAMQPEYHPYRYEP